VNNVTNVLNSSISDCITNNMLRKIKIESRIVNLRIVENAIEEVTSEIGIKQDSYGKILVSTLEAVNNAIIHGNNSIPEKIVQIEIVFSRAELKIRVKDEGSGFRPLEVPDPTLPDNIESLNGRGVFLMSRLADEIKYNKKGNIVTMTFRTKDIEH
jgi:serine/threonine-protein kinase RsbW